MRRPAFTEPSQRLRPLYDSSTLDRLNSATLKKLARRWVGKEANRLNKGDCIRAVARGLPDREALGALVESLTDFERAGLGLLKLRGGVAHIDELALELWVLGLPPEATRRSRRRFYSGSEDVFYEALNSLLGEGLLMMGDWDGSAPRTKEAEVRRWSYVPAAWSDWRILEHLDVSIPATLDLSPVTPPESGLSKSPAEVALRLISLSEGLRKAESIPMTRAGRPAKPFLTRLAKSLGWKDVFATQSDTPLRDAMLFLLKLLDRLGLLDSSPSGGSLALKPDAGRFFEQSPVEQSTALMQAYRSLNGWTEHLPDSIYGFREEDEASSRKFRALRAGLLLALGALPDPREWYRISDVSDMIFDRVGQRFSLGSFSTYYRGYRTTSEGDWNLRQEWEAKIAEKWDENELPWMAAAMRGPLYHLGLVELGFEPRQKKSGLSLFRLSQLGRAVLYDTLREGTTPDAVELQVPAPRSGGACWSVQSSFEVVLHLERASPSQLAFIERIAEQRSTPGAATVYQITHGSVYAGLETGLEPDQLLETLAQGAEQPIPPNVRRTIKDWAAQRERLAVRPAAEILEFAGPEARDQARGSAKLEGVPLGDRYLLLRKGALSQPQERKCSAIIDYAEPASRCLEVEEDGSVGVTRSSSDLYVRGELAHFAEGDSTDGDCWQLTRASVQASVSRGLAAEAILLSLSERITHDLPLLVQVTVRAWAGELDAPNNSVGVASEPVLQVKNDQVAKAIASSALLAPFIRKRLGPKTFLVRRDHAESLSEKLRDLGLAVAEDLAEI